MQIAEHDPPNNHSKVQIPIVPQFLLRLALFFQRERADPELQTISPFFKLGLIACFAPFILTTTGADTFFAMINRVL